MPCAPQYPKPPPRNPNNPTPLPRIWVRSVKIRKPRLQPSPIRPAPPMPHQMPRHLPSPPRRKPHRSPVNKRKPSPKPPGTRRKTFLAATGLPHRSAPPVCPPAQRTFLCSLGVLPRNSKPLRTLQMSLSHRKAAYVLNSLGGPNRADSNKRSPPVQFRLTSL
jgi:hypothetical protein